MAEKQCDLLKNGGGMNRKFKSTSTISFPFNATDDCFLLMRVAANANATAYVYLKSATYGDYWAGVQAFNGGNNFTCIPVFKGDTISVQSEGGVYWKTCRVIY